MGGKAFKTEFSVEPALFGEFWREAGVVHESLESLRKGFRVQRIDDQAVATVFDDIPAEPAGDNG